MEGPLVDCLNMVSIIDAYMAVSCTINRHTCNSKTTFLLADCARSQRSKRSTSLETTLKLSITCSPTSAPWKYPTTESSDKAPTSIIPGDLLFCLLLVTCPCPRWTPAWSPNHGLCLAAKWTCRTGQGYHLPRAPIEFHTQGCRSTMGCGVLSRTLEARWRLRVSEGHLQRRLGWILAMRELVSQLKARDKDPVKRYKPPISCTVGTG